MDKTKKKQAATLMVDLINNTDRVVRNDPVRPDLISVDERAKWIEVISDASDERFALWLNTMKSGDPIPLAAEIMDYARKIIYKNLPT
jgi:predicted component of type VI protein secretion system